MESQEPKITVLSRIRRFLHTHVQHTPGDVARALKERGVEFNNKLLQKRIARRAHAGGVSEHMQIPDRWYTTSYDDLLSFHMRSNDPRMAQTLPDSGWGLLGEATKCFALNGNKLLDADFEALKALVQEGEDFHTITLAELCKRKETKERMREAVKLKTKRITGKS